MVARSEDVLHGMKSICSYYGRSEATILKLYEQSGFPIRRLPGGWTASRMLIDQWNKDFIAGRMQRWVRGGNTVSVKRPGP